MKVRIFIGFIFITGIVVLGLSFRESPALNKQELMKYINDPRNGLVQNITKNGFSFDVKYFPLQKVSEGKRGIEEVLSKNKQLCFKMHISYHDRELIYKFGREHKDLAVMNHLIAYGMSDKVFLLTSENDTILLTDYVSPPTYGMAEKTRFMFQFPVSPEIEKSDWVDLLINGDELGFGWQRFRFRTEDIENTPSLKNL